MLAEGAALLLLLLVEEDVGHKAAFSFASLGVTHPLHTAQVYNPTRRGEAVTLDAAKQARVAVDDIPVLCMQSSSTGLAGSAWPFPMAAMYDSHCASMQPIEKGILMLGSCGALEGYGGLGSGGRGGGVARRGLSAGACAPSKKGRTSSSAAMRWCRDRRARRGASYPSSIPPPSRPEVFPRPAMRITTMTKAAKPAMVETEKRTARHRSRRSVRGLCAKYAAAEEEDDDAKWLAASPITMAGGKLPYELVWW